RNVESHIGLGKHRKERRGLAGERFRHIQLRGDARIDDARKQRGRHRFRSSRSISTTLGPPGSGLKRFCAISSRISNTVRGGRAGLPSAIAPEQRLSPSSHFPVAGSFLIWTSTSSPGASPRSSLNSIVRPLILP